MDENSRFRRTLKNPMVVGGLCLVAMYAVYHNIMDSPLTQSPSSYPSPSHSQGVGTPTPIQTTSHPQETRVVEWVHRPKRDPFAFPIPAGTSPTTVTKKPLPQEPSLGSPVENRLTLKAVAVEGDTRSAVINRSIVYEGENISGYEVLSIRPDGVWVSAKGKRQWLTFGEESTS